MKNKVLIIDDVPETREFIRFVLEQAGYSVDEAEDGRQGLQKAQREPFDLIITDLAMPGMDGFTLVKQLRTSSAMGDTKIIISTAHGKLKDMFEVGKKSGVQYFIEKPFMAEELIEKVEKVLGK